MENKSKSLGRAFLVGKLQAQGLSRRQSVLIVNVILERMIRALKRDWEVEFPLGKLTRVKRHFSKLWDAIDDWPANRDPHTIRTRSCTNWTRPELGSCTLGRGRKPVLQTRDLDVR